MPASIGVNLRVTGHCSQGGRKYMEDFFSVAYQQSLSDEQDLEYAFIGIYDGHGGSEAATFAKENLINLIVNQKLFWSNDDRDILRAIRGGYIATHNAMISEQEKWPKTAAGLPSTAGTTASIAFIRHGKIYIGHVGDSGIVLGYQEEGEKFWRAKPLTQDHKPECNIEKARIMNSGGKVVTKCGVPRVVWNRPRLGHKGPVRRNTPIDEIPFLAVARSLGDLWSYNPALNEFVVSPDPDVRVIKIDPKKFRCLIFGTDGLWGVLSAQTAVESVRMAEQMNDRNISSGGSREWTNPSKNLVDKALESWSTRRMRADNTSVVIIMLDPPGPPKRDVLRTCSTPPYQMDYLPNCSQSADARNQIDHDSDNLTMYDHGTLDTIPLPTSGLAIMTRYENANGEYAADKHSYMPVDSPQAHSSNIDLHYMNSFAESYNSLLENDNEYRYASGRTPETEHGAIDYDDDSGDGSNQYASQHHTDTYSLTKLETRTEQQINSQRISIFGESSSASSELVGQVLGHGSSYSDYQEHNYMGTHQQHFASMSRSYLTTEDLESSSSRFEDATTELPVEASVENTFQDLHYYENQKVLVQPAVNNGIEICESFTADIEIEEGETSNLVADHSIQINEISSSECDVLDQKLNGSQSGVSKTRCVNDSTTIKVHMNKNNTASLLHERKITRSATALMSPQVRRSTRHDQTLHQILKNRKTNSRRVINGIGNKLSAIITGSSNAIKTKFHKENMAVLRKIRQNMAKDLAASCSTANGISNSVLRTRKAPPQISSTIIDKRTLRSQNILAKDVKRLNSSALTTKQVTSKSTRGELLISQKLPKFKKLKVQITKNLKNNNNIQLVNHNTVITRSLREIKSPRVPVK